MSALEKACLAAQHAAEKIREAERLIMQARNQIAEQQGIINIELARIEA